MPLTKITNTGVTGLTIDSSGNVSGQTKNASTSPIDLTSNTNGYTFSSIPSVYQLLTLTVKGWSCSSTSNFQMQLGTSSGLKTSGYRNQHHYFTASANSQTDESDMNLAHFSPTSWNGAGNLMHMIIHLYNHNDNNWFLRGSFVDENNDQFISIWNGYVDLGGTLTQIKIFPQITNAIDSGTANLLYG